VTDNILCCALGDIQMRRLLDWGGLRDKGIKWSKGWINEKEKRGEFPRRVPLAPGGRQKGWVEEEIEHHIDLQIAERDHPSAKAQALEQHALKQVRKAANVRWRRRQQRAATQVEQESG
jgi:predicted DNA-binding transcriptional regulator AlpA